MKRIKTEEFGWINWTDRTEASYRRFLLTVTGIILLALLVLILLLGGLALLVGKLFGAPVPV